MDRGWDSGWPNGARCAVSLTYTSGRGGLWASVHQDLQVADLKATFYVPPLTVLDEIGAWTLAALEGHEVGSHSLSGFTDADGSLPSWTLDMVDADLAMTRELVEDVLPTVEPVSFAYPGPNPVCADGEYRTVVARHHRWARGAHEGLNHPVFSDPHDLRCSRVRVPDDAYGAIDEAARRGAWAILAIPGVGPRAGEMRYEHHAAMCRYLSTERGVWVAPLREVGAVAQTVRPTIVA